MDHDLLITLNADFQSFVRQYRLDIKDLKDGTTMKLGDHESRIRLVEHFLEKIDPKEIEANTKFRERLLTQISMIVIFGSLIMTFIYRYMENFINWLFKK